MIELVKSQTGLIYNFTGDGKGKSSAAFGVIIRALGWHWKVAVLQFIKSKRETGERNFFAEYFPDIIFESCGLGLTSRAGDHAGFAHAGWERAAQLLQNFDGELLVLDELNIALAHGFLDSKVVREALKNRKSSLNVIITGRNSPPEILDVSDLVSEINVIKHPYQNGIMAQKGLDY